MDGGAPPDENVDVQKARRGDVEAFERLYRRHAARVHTLARRLLGAREADDATQEVFLRAWRKLSTYRGEGAFGAWLLRLAGHLMLSRARRSRTESLHEHGLREQDSHKTTATGPADRARDLEEAIAALPEGARQVLVLHDIEGYGHAEIARASGISPGTSKSQLHRARMLLRQAMAPGSGASMSKEPADA
jgi:RNA polymerase sigma-70 factor (ECF subfamily)